MTQDANRFAPVTPTTSGKRVLVVDDEETVRDVVAAYLHREGFEVETAADGDLALDAFERRAPDMIVLDVMLPNRSGLEVLSTIRRLSTTPVILLTARTDEADRVVGLEMGADDYVVKPFSPREVVARVKTILKRVGPSEHVGDRLEFDGLTIDGATRDVWLAGDWVELTPREFDLLYFLACSPRQVFSRNQLLEHVWGSSSEWQDPATVTVHIGRLRNKLEGDPVDPRWIGTIWGVGYRFEP